jgi:hypothetical protein
MPLQKAGQFTWVMTNLQTMSRFDRDFYAKKTKKKTPQNKAVVKMAFDLLLFATRGLPS